jgi:SAM-dependent methyltransferase
LDEMKNGRPQDPWPGNFDGASPEIRDTEASNEYFSVKNFRFFKSAVLNLLGPVENASILDVGCGTGHFSQPLAQKNRLVGLDILPGMLMLARRKGLSPVRASAERLPFRDGRFDIALANSVIQLIREGREFIGELMRVLKPGGRLVLGTINAESAALVVFKIVERRKYRHFRLYPMNELREYIVSAGGELRSSLWLFYPFGKIRIVAGDRLAGRATRCLATSVAVEAVRLR